MGIAADSRGNMWVSNSATIKPPCPDGGGDLMSTDGSVTMICRDGRATKGPFIGDGLTIPWGIAVDGDDNVWVANFGGQRLSNIDRDVGRCESARGVASPRAGQEPLPREIARVALPDVDGRIDHLTVDASMRRLFVAALGNGTVEVVDLGQASRVARVKGL